MQETTTVLVPAKDISLLTLYEAKIALNLTTSSSDTLDDQLEILIRQASDEIAQMCNRVLAQETVEDKYTEFETDLSRIFLSHYPVKTIHSISDGGSSLGEGDWEMESRSGKLVRVGGTWAEPVVVNYTGGYDLPFEAPEALRQAAVLLSRESYFASIRGDASIRMVAHKESRVIYFDPSLQMRNAAGAAAAGGGSAARRSIDALLKKYTRFFI